MALAVTLEASFTSDGSFDLDATITGLGAQVLGVDFGSEEFDPSAVLSAVADLAPPDLAAIADMASQVADSVDTGIGIDIDALLAPLRDLLAPLDLLGGDVDLSIPASGIGLDGLASGVVDGLGLLTAGPLEPVLGLLRQVTGGLDVAGPAVEIGESVAGAIALIRLLGGLLAVRSLACRADRDAALVAGMLNGPGAAADAALVRRLSAGDLASRVASVPASDPAAADALVAEIRSFAVAVRTMGESWSVGLGFGEAALVALDVDTLATSFELALGAVDESLVSSVASLCARLGTLADPVLSVELPDARDSLDATFDAVVELVDPLRQAVDAIDASGLTDAMAAGLGQVTAPVVAVTEVMESVGASVGATIRELADVVESIDLGPVVDAVDRALAPVTAALDAVDDAVGDAIAVIQAVATGITDGLDEVADLIGTVATTVNAALGALSAQLSTIDFAAIQATIEGGLGSVADALASAQLSPYFDAANDVIDTTAEVIDAVPFGLLPTDIQQEIVDLSRPVKQIDFDAIADSLRAELKAIRDALDDDVLDEVDAAFGDVIAFLESIDPGAAIAEFEAGAFAELRVVVEGLDPEALLAPVEEVLAPIRSLLTGVDLRATVLDPVAGVFDDIRGSLADVDPAVLLADARAEVDSLRQQITDSLALTTWASSLTRTRDQVVATLDLLDPAALASAASGGVMERLRDDHDTGPGLVGNIVATLGQATGLAAEAESWSAVSSWFGDVDGSVEVRTCLDGAVAALDETATTVRGLDPAPVVAAAGAHHRRLLDAVRARPADDRLRVAAEPLLVDNAPSAVLAPLIENRARYVTALDGAVGTVRRLSGTGTSQITAVTGGLRVAVLPVTSVLDWVRSLLGRFGLADLDQPWSELLADLLTALGPDRLLPVLVEVVTALRDKLTSVIDAAVGPVLDAVTAIEDAAAVLDLGPVLDELTGVHDAVVDLVDDIDPAVQLGPTLDAADALVARVAHFDPLEPVSDVIDSLRDTIDDVFETTSPSVVFAPVMDVYDTVLDIASGLDVKGLLQPVLDALDGLALQLDVGIDETADALGRLQAALPDRVEDSAASVSGSVSVGLSL